MVPLHHCSYGDFPLFATWNKINSVKTWSITPLYEPKKMMQRPCSVPNSKTKDGIPLYGITHHSVVSQHFSNHPGVWLRLLAVAKSWQGSAGKQSFMLLTRPELQSQASTAAVLVAVPKLAVTSAAALPSSWQPPQMARPDQAWIKRPAF